MADRKNEIAPSSQKAASKWILKKLAEKREGQAQEAKRNAKEASCLVQCASKPGKGYIMLMRLEGDKATVYDVKALYGSGGGSSTSSAQNLRINDYDIEPGVSDRCPACGNEGRFICSCGTYSCLPANAKQHVCPGCKSKSTSFRTISHIDVSQAKNRHGSSKTGSTEKSQVANTKTFLLGN